MNGLRGIIPYRNWCPVVIAAENFDVVAEVDDFVAAGKKDVEVFFAVLINVVAGWPLKTLSKEVKGEDIFLGKPMELPEQ